jgi:hypothetical protein
MEAGNINDVEMESDQEKCCVCGTENDLYIRRDEHCGDITYFCEECD